MVSIGQTSQRIGLSVQWQQPFSRASCLMRMFKHVTLFFTVFIPIIMQGQHPGFCDPTTGLCTPAPLEQTTTDIEWREDVEIIYVGDPMCSWCWGISPQLNQLQRKANAEGIRYRIVVGGLRPGGGDAWNQQFKDFLQHHWEEVNKRSGQPFGDALFDLEQFEYDTEPACRAVVAARTIDPSVEGRFFELVQHYFYVKNQDPKTIEFYEPICKEVDINFAEFASAFISKEIREATRNEFVMNRQWGVQGYPSVLVRKGSQLYAIARGYSEVDDMWAEVERLIK